MKAKETFNKLVERYKKPTPQVWRQLGDALLAVSTFIIGSAVYLELGKWVVIASLIIGVGGKFLTNFFAVENKE